ncbi:hypothetical protein A1351_22025 [Methylosinus sp. R-45379]|uniref:hypothetical protein n=1 Tax=Methylosinus sp. R-45379 TaxID=980563 RepID=UPI0007C920E7|nr:hypothetical protein [Methylosinus sp. R-45379]OAI31105.1 hypothetical protein A1351_22025 [Methylosinus sp. R-45379]
MRKFWLLAGAACCVGAKASLALAIAAPRPLLLLNDAFLWLQDACLRVRLGESARAVFFAWWVRAFTWPAPPRGWRVRTGGAAGVIYYPAALTELEALRLAARWRDAQRNGGSMRVLDADQGEPR